MVHTFMLHFDIVPSYETLHQNYELHNIECVNIRIKIIQHKVMCCTLTVKTSGADALQ